MMKIFLKQPAFTLAELLIALAILGVIATFTIPKVLDSGSGGKHNAIVKETASSVAAVYQKLKLEGNVDANTAFSDFTPFLNYVKEDSTTTIDWSNNAGSVSCSSSWRCILLHSGAMVYYNTGGFGGTETTTAMYFVVDPDGVYGGSTTGPSKSTIVFLYYTGLLRTQGTVEPNTYWQTTAYNPAPANDPEYFSWGN